MATEFKLVCPYYGGTVDLIADINTQLSVLDKRIMHYYSTNTKKEILYYKYIKETEQDSYFKINLN